jgi:hypothetical protein
MHQYPKQEPSRQPKPIAEGVTTSTLAHSKPSQEAQPSQEAHGVSHETVTASETIAIKIMRRKPTELRKHSNHQQHLATLMKHSFSFQR